MSQSLSRKTFVTSLGAAGLGLGLMLRGATGAGAQDAAETVPALPAVPARPDFEEFGEKRAELYKAFTTALASEIGGGATSDTVDAAVRKAVMTVIDEQISDEGLTSGQAEALKVLVATSDAPIGPTMLFMGHPGMMMGMGMGHGGPKGRMRITRGGDDAWEDGQDHDRIFIAVDEEPLPDAEGEDDSDMTAEPAA